MRWGGVLAGILIGGLALVVLWAADLLAPPERLMRAVAAFDAVFPGSIASATVDRIDCPPLRNVRLYTVCTEGCQEVWRIVAVRGLLATPLANPGRLPPEPRERLQENFNALVERERLDLDDDGARRMIACVLRLNGLYPELVLGEGDIAAAVASVGDDEAERAVVGRLTASPPEDRIPIEEVAAGYRSRMYYWDTATLGRPVVRMDLLMARDGRVRSVVTDPEPITGGTASGNTRDTPPI